MCDKLLYHIHSSKNFLKEFFQTGTMYTRSDRKREMEYAVFFPEDDLDYRINRALRRGPHFLRLSVYTFGTSREEISSPVQEKTSIRLYFRNVYLGDPIRYYVSLQ